MKHIIEMEETLIATHQIEIEVESLADAEKILDSPEIKHLKCRDLDFDDFVEELSAIVPISEVNKDYCVESKTLEWCDDYPGDDY